MTTTLAPPVSPKPTNKDHHWTVDAFYKAYDAGAFGYAKRLELIQGRIIEKMPPGPHHSYLADAVAHMLRVTLEPPLLVREEKAVRIAFDGQPIPDVTVVRGTRAEYLDRHPVPEDVALLVEVADTSVEHDLGEKALLYAQAGVSDYWVVLVNEAAHRPAPGAVGAGLPRSDAAFGKRRAFTAGDAGSYLDDQRFVRARESVRGELTGTRFSSYPVA